MALYNRRSRGRQCYDRITSRHDNHIIFTDKVNAQAHREFMGLLNYCTTHDYEEIIIDFSNVINAYPNGMIPIIANLDRRKRDGYKINIIMPYNMDAKRLFITTNWSHCLDPQNYNEEITRHYRHLVCKRFYDATEQHNIVNEFIDIAIMNMNLERSVISGLEWSINEITDNVLNHSESADGGIAQVSTFPSNNSVSFAVVDSGVGIYKTLKKAIPTIHTDIHAIGEAVKAGVTRDPEIGQGNGLAGTLRISTMTGGSFAITSGTGHINYFKRNPRRYTRKSEETFQGTIICADILINAKTFSLSEALGFSNSSRHEPVDYIELNYLNEDKDMTKFNVKTESTGFGNRFAGKQLRTKVMNILNAEPTIPICIDWTGIPLTSSSFADEFMGKLFIEMGALTFGARVRNVGMEKLIRDLVERAISQRLTAATDEL